MASYISDNSEDFDIIKFLRGFREQKSETSITLLYIQGKITKEEFFKRMKNAR